MRARGARDAARRPVAARHGRVARADAAAQVLGDAALRARAAGARAAWDTAAAQVVAPATGMVPIGVALAVAGNGATTVRVRLDGVATQAAA